MCGKADQIKSSTFVGKRMERVKEIKRNWLYFLSMCARAHTYTQFLKGLQNMFVPTLKSAGLHTRSNQLLFFSSRPPPPNKYIYKRIVRTHNNTFFRIHRTSSFSASTSSSLLLSNSFVSLHCTGEFCILLLAAAEDFPTESFTLSSRKEPPLSSNF